MKDLMNLTFHAYEGISKAPFNIEVHTHIPEALEFEKNFKKTISSSSFHHKLSFDVIAEIFLSWTPILVTIC